VVVERQADPYREQPLAARIVRAVNAYVELTGGTAVPAAGRGDRAVPEAAGSPVSAAEVGRPAEAADPAEAAGSAEAAADAAAEEAAEAAADAAAEEAAEAVGGVAAADHAPCPGRNPATHPTKDRATYATQDHAERRAEVHAERPAAGPAQCDLPPGPAPARDRPRHVPPHVPPGGEAVVRALERLRLRTRRDFDPAVVEALARALAGPPRSAPGPRTHG
jgi:hypothetical protein